MSKQDKLLKESKKLCWEDRLLHKNSKVRYAANIDLKFLCDSITDPKDHRISELGHLFKKTVSDSDAIVQDKALDALIAYLKAADAQLAGRYAKEVCDAIMAKCLTGRPKTKEKAQAAFMLWVELDAVDACLDVMEKAIKCQDAEAVVLATDFMIQALSEFGPVIVSMDRIVMMLRQILNHQDQNVLASSKRLSLELSRWVGILPIQFDLYKHMSDTMKKELDVELPNVKVAIDPPRKIRSAPKGRGFLGIFPPIESAAETPVGKDGSELVDRVDIITPLSKSGFWNKVKSRRWTQRKEALAKLSELASAKRIIAPRDFTDLCPTLKKLITDRNIFVRVEAVRAIGNLAMEVNFSRCSLILLPLLLAKFSEKNPIMTEAVTNTLEAIHKAECVTLANILTDVQAAVKSEDPHVCSRTLNWLVYCIESSSKEVILYVLKDYDRICLECLNDETAEVRDAALSVLVTMEKSVGIELSDMPLEKLDNIRRNKLSEMRTGFSGGGAPSVARRRIMKQGVSRRRFPKAIIARDMKADGPSQIKLVEDKDVEPSKMIQLKNAAGKRPLEEVNQLQKLSLSDPIEQNEMDVDGETDSEEPSYFDEFMPAEWCTTCGLIDDYCRCTRSPNMELSPSLFSSSYFEIPPFVL